MNLLRASLYALEGFPLQLVNRALSNRWGSENHVPKEYLENAIEAGRAFLKLDAERAASGLYPAKLLLPEMTPIEHLKSLVDLWIDGTKVAWRMRQKSHHDLKDVKREDLEHAPDYYQRNFHYQSDGYFSYESAKRYDHQVEVLFKGAASAMRRLALIPLVETFKNQKGRVLEVAAGNGSATRQVVATLPNIRITATDLSAQYLDFLKGRLPKGNRVDILQADATELPFKDEIFDGWYSVFLFHELPKDERIKALREAHRVLKRDGLLVFVDSMQIDDQPLLNWGLEQFPKDFHEPFYKNYVTTPMESLIEQAGFQITHREVGLLSKCIGAKKKKK